MNEKTKLVMEDNDGTFAWLCDEHLEQCKKNGMYLSETFDGALMHIDGKPYFSCDVEGCQSWHVSGVIIKEEFWVE